MENSKPYPNTDWFSWEKDENFERKSHTEESLTEAKLLTKDDVIGDYDAELKREDVEDRRQDREQRMYFAKRIFWLITVYLAVSLLLVFFSHWRHISDAVLITLLSTTTTTVLGLFIIVAKYLFHR